jgi:hypothetical protein
MGKAGKKAGGKAGGAAGAATALSPPIAKKGKVGTSLHQTEAGAWRRVTSGGRWTDAVDRAVDEAEVRVWLWSRVVF